MKWRVLFIHFFFVLCHYGKVTGTGGVDKRVKDPDVYRNVVSNTSVFSLILLIVEVVTIDIFKQI